MERAVGFLIVFMFAVATGYVLANAIGWVPDW